MSYIKSYDDGDYEVTKYTGGGTVRKRGTNEIVATYANYWTKDGETHEQTKKQLDYIKEKLGIVITL